VSADALAARIATRFAEFQIELSAQQAELLAAYQLRVLDDNSRHNLTRITEPDEFIDKHLLDSAILLPWLKGPRVLDVGTGAGLPGVVLAILRPQWRFTLLDARRKKVLLLRDTLTALGLEQVQAEHARAEDWPGGGQDTVLARAVASLPELLRLTGHLGARSGAVDADGSPFDAPLSAGSGSRWLLMKGQWPETELSGWPPGFTVRGVWCPRLPPAVGARHLFWIERF